MNMNPVIFGNGQLFYETLAKKYVTHPKGLFILAPSGSGKTYFCKNQTTKHWIDGDDLWMGAGAHPEGSWWFESLKVINRVDQRSDIITVEAKKEGFWIMGASNFWLKPDAIVIPDWETHKAYIAHREEHDYDGGAKSDDHDQVLGHVEFIKKWHTDHGVPMFGTIAEAVMSLTVDA